MRKTTFKSNLDVIQAKGKIPYWKISLELNCHENTLIKWMRTEMEDDRKSLVLKAISKVKQHEGI